MPQLAAVGRLMGTPRRLAASGAFDAMQALHAATAGIGVAQLISSSIYSGNAYGCTRSSDGATRNFLPGTTALDLAAWGQTAGAAVIYGHKWYDQFGAGIDSDTLTTGSSGQAPTMDCSLGLYPVPTFNGTSQRIGWTSPSALCAFNTTANGNTFGIAHHPVAAASSTTRALMCSSQASGNTIRAGLAYNTTPLNQARTVRSDAGSAFGSNPPWDTNPNVLFCVTDYPNHIVTGYKNNVTPGATSIGAALTPAFVNSGGIFIGGMASDATLFASTRMTVAVFYQAIISANLAALQSAFEAAA